MATTRFVVKNPAQASNSVYISGFNTNRYSVGKQGDRAYGIVAAGKYQAGDTITFPQVPSKKIISGTISSLDATPVVLKITPSTDLTSAISFTTTGSLVGFNYDLVYSDGAGDHTHELKLTLVQ